MKWFFVGLAAFGGLFTSIIFTLVIVAVGTDNVLLASILALPLSFLIIGTPIILINSTVQYFRGIK